MWRVDAQNLIMTEGDFGIKLPITISGITFAANDSVKLTIKAQANGDTVIEKEYTDIPQSGTFNLEITEAETALLPVGVYVYILDWYQDGAFMCNIIPTALFKVVDKA